MFTRKKDVFRFLFPLVVYFITVSVWAQIVPSGVRLMTFAGTDGYGSSLFHLHGLQASVGTNNNNNGPNNHDALDPTHSYAVSTAAVHDNVAGQNLRPSMTTKEVTTVGADLSSTDHKLPATLTVRTAALLELHAMRQSAVSLCLQLPTRYRTRLPQCAEIFKHEIRLAEIAKHGSQ